MDLKSLLQPAGDPVKPLLYGILYAFVGASGLIVVAFQYGAPLWAAVIAFYSVVSAAMILGVGHALCAGLGGRMPAAWGVGIAVVVGCIATQVLDIAIYDAL